jgi:hypothetical protein
MGIRGCLGCILCQERLMLSRKPDECKPLDTGGAGTSGDPRRPGPAHTRGAAAGSGTAGGYHHGGSRSQSPGRGAYTPLGAAASHESGGYTRLGMPASHDSGGYTYTRLGMSSTASTPVQHEQAARRVGPGSGAADLRAERQRTGAGAAGMSAMGMGSHSSTFQLNLSRFGHASPCPPV